MLTRIRGRARLALAGGLIVVLVVGLTAAYSILRPQQALGAQATLTILTGTVEVRESAAGSFGSGVDGGVLGPGATVRTGEDGNAIITFFDGSTVTIEPSSELTLEQLEATSSGDMLISILQTVGRSWHVIGHKLDDGSQYQVRTPTATASVRGTSFEFDVDPQGKGKALTEEGVVQLESLGQITDVGAGKQAEAPPNEAPTAPVDAPPPDNVVKVIIDPTNSAAAVDSKGRSVGIVNGIPSVTVPRGKVEYVGGKIVMSVPVDGTERVSTVVQSTDPSKAVAIQTQVETKGVIVNNTIEVRAPDASGLAKGGVALTSTGVIVLPDSEAQQFTAPKIAQAPGVEGAGQVSFPATQKLADLPNVAIASLAPGASAPTTFRLPEGVQLPSDFKVGEFKGGFQQLSFFGVTENLTKQPGFDATKAQGLSIVNSGFVQAPTTFNYATFTGELPAGVIPNAPPGASDLSKFAGFTAPSGVTFTFAPSSFAPVAPGQSFDPATLPSFNISPETQQQFQQNLSQFQQIATQLQQQGAFGPAATGQPIEAGASPGPGNFPFNFGISPLASPGANDGGVGPSPFRTGQLPEGCRDLGFLGVVCSGTTPAASPGVLPSGAPVIGTFGPGGTFPPNFTFAPGATFPGGGTFPTTTFITCTPPLVPLPGGGCGQAPTGTFTPTGTFPTGSFTPFPTSTSGTFRCPDGSSPVNGVCPAPSGSFTPFPTSTSGTFRCPDGSNPVNGICPTPSGSFTPFPTGSFTPPPSGSFTPFPTSTSGGFKCPDGSDPVNGTCPTPPPTGTFTPPPTTGTFTPPPSSFTPPPTQQQFTPPPDATTPPPPAGPTPP